MQKYLFLMFASLIIVNANAQNEADTSSSKDAEGLKDLHWLTDSTFRVFKTTKFSNLKVMYPSFSTYKKFIDTSAAGDQSDITKFTMYNAFWNSLRLQHVKMMKKAAKAKIKWPDTTLDSFYIDSGGEGSNAFARIFWIVKNKNKKKYILSALTLKMTDKWFIMDEMKFLGQVPEKKKKKIKR